MKVEEFFNLSFYLCSSLKIRSIPFILFGGFLFSSSSSVPPYPPVYAHTRVHKQVDRPFSNKGVFFLLCLRLKSENRILTHNHFSQVARSRISVLPWCSQVDSLFFKALYPWLGNESVTVPPEKEGDGFLDLLLLFLLLASLLLFQRCWLLSPFLSLCFPLLLFF